MRLWRALKVENSLLWNDIFSMDPDFEQNDMITRLILLKKLQITDFAVSSMLHPWAIFSPKAGLYCRLASARLTGSIRKRWNVDLTKISEIVERGTKGECFTFFEEDGICFKARDTLSKGFVQLHYIPILEKGHGDIKVWRKVWRHERELLHRIAGKMIVPVKLKE